VVKCLCFCIFGGSIPHIRQIGTANCAAAALRELPAALVPIQRRQPSQPPVKSADLADCSLAPACNFGGNYANYAQFTNIITYKYSV